MNYDNYIGIVRSNVSYRDYMSPLKDQRYDSLWKASVALESADVNTINSYIKNANNE